MTTTELLNTLISRAEQDGLPERIGLVQVARSGSGERRYDRAALGRVIFITRLRWSGMSIRDITAYGGACSG